MHLKEYITERKNAGYKTEYLWVDNQKDSDLTLDGFKHWVNKIRKDSRVNFHLHRFQHTFACNLAHNNASLIKIQKSLGHKSPKMTATYLRSEDAVDLREDIDNLNVGSFM